MSQREEQIESESLQVGSLQPNFFEPEDNIAATIGERDGWIGVRGFANVDRMVGHSLIDNDPSTGITWLAIAPETFRTPASGSHASLAGRLFSQQISIDLGGRFLIREFRMRPFEDNPNITSSLYALLLVTGTSTMMTVIMFLRLTMKLF